MKARTLIFAAVFFANASLHALGLTIEDFPIPIWAIAAGWGGWFTALACSIAGWYRRRGRPAELNQHPEAVVIQGGGNFHSVKDDQHIHFHLGIISIPKSVPVRIVTATDSAASGPSAVGAGAKKIAAQ